MNFDFWDFYKQIKLFVCLHRPVHLGIRINKIIGEGRVNEKMTKEQLEEYLQLNQELSKKFTEWNDIARVNIAKVQNILDK